jgi:multidrug efflux pump subunit AcrB
LIPVLPKGFIPKLDRGEFNIVYTAPATTSLDQSRQIAQQLETVVRRSPQVETVFTTVGSRQGQPNQGTLFVQLQSDRSLHTAEVQDQLRQQLPALPGVTTSIEDIQFVDTGGEKPLQVALLGDDPKTLNQTAQKIKDRVQKLPGFADVTATGEGQPPDTLFEIQHLNGRRVAYVGANLGQDQSLGDATDKVVAEAKAVLPPGVSLQLGGDSGRVGEVFGSFGSTLGLSVLCILLVLLLLFRSWTDPLVIAFSLPLAIVGAMLALLLTQSDFGMISLIGVIFLMGLVNKNAILIVDYINQLRDSGVNRGEAIVEAGQVRLRPILMTTASTILGMLPIALGLGAGSELRAPMAIAIIGGLVTSTLLSLIVVPVIYALLDDWHPRRKRRTV